MDQARPIAYLALMLVVPGTIAAFSMLRATRATLVVTLVALLFLPQVVSFDAPLVPPLDKNSIPALCLLIALIVCCRREMRAAKWGRGIDLLLLGTLVSIVLSVLTNRDPIEYPKVVIAGHEPKDILSQGIRELLGPLVPFFIGRVLFRTAEDAKDLLRALVISGLVYLPFILIELRLSPQWHNWIYGFGQHAFQQTIRAGGYRPMVFMAHGLALALFIWATGVAAWTLAAVRAPLFGVSSKVFAWVLTVLLGCIHSMGAVVYGIAIYPLVWLGRPKTQLRVAVILAFLVMLYPVLRTTGTFPAQGLVDLAAKVNQDRAESLDFRFRNEELLLARALERPWFGWAANGRGRVRDEEGRDVSVTDGEWIIMLGSYGIVGFAMRFGLLLIPVLSASRRLRKLGQSEQHLLAGTSLIAVVYALDLLPNGLFNELPMFFSGAVMGLVQGMSTAGARDPRAVLRARLLAALRQLNPAPTTTSLRPP